MRVIAARLDRLAIDKIDAPREQGFQRLLEIEKAPEIILLRSKLDQKIEIAPRRIEIAARSRAKYVQPPHGEAAAQVPQLLAWCMVRYFGHAAKVAREAN